MRVASSRGGLLVRLALPAVAIAIQAAVFAGILEAQLAGYRPHDYLAYDGAIRHLLAGRPIYDPSVALTGGLGLFLYPPTFLLLILPLAALSTSAASVVWVLLLAVVSVVAIAVMPVSQTVRWAMLALAALSWPLVNGIGQGQVGPVLLLLFAMGWRWMERPARLGAAMALGTAIKLQPALLIGWAVLAGRRRAAAIAVAVFVALAVVATLLVGPQAWLDQMSSLARTNNPILSPNNLAIAALAYQAGVPLEPSWALYWLNLAALGVVTLVAVWRSSAVGSFLATVVASQAVSPVIWPHYALILLLPTAWLLARGRAWAIVIPLATSIPLAAITPPLLYPLVFWVALVAVTWEGRVERDGTRVSVRAGIPMVASAGD